jgi:hypothetical protein
MYYLIDRDGPLRFEVCCEGGYTLFKSEKGRKAVELVKYTLCRIGMDISNL